MSPEAISGLAFLASVRAAQAFSERPIHLLALALAKRLFRKQSGGFLREFRDGLEYPLINILLGFIRRSEVAL